jgi:hypothetical protein
MTGEFDHIARCLDLQERDIVAAIATRVRTKALLAHLAAISAPDTGVAKALLVLSRMATTACDWIDGDLFLELIAAGDRTRVEAVTELGGGLRERVFPSMVFQAPLDEFGRAIARVSHMIAPLRVRTTSAQRITLGATEVARRTSLPPPPIEISADSLFLRLPEPAPTSQRAERSAPELLRAVTDASSTADVDAGWDD